MSDWKLKRQIVQVGAFLLVMVAVLSIYIAYLAVWEGQELAENPLNMRGAAAKADIRRGTIFDAHGRVLAQTQNDGTRTYPLGQVMAHITGYNGENIGSAGLEGHANRELLGLTADMSRLGPAAQLLQTLEYTNIDALLGITDSAMRIISFLVYWLPLPIILVWCQKSRKEV